MKLRWAALVAVLVGGAGGCGSSSGGTPCTTSVDCDGRFCSSTGVCIDNGTCRADDDCPRQEICAADQTCAPPPGCTGPGDCQAGEACSATGDCVPQGTCLVDDDCAAAEFCSVTRTCVADGSCAVREDCDDGYRCTEAFVCEIGSDCGQIEAAVQEPDLLLVMDRSCTMNGLLESGDFKWGAAVAAIDNLTTTFGSQIHWGLQVYPGRKNEVDFCQVPTGPTIAIGSDTGAEIRAFLEASLAVDSDYYPDGPCFTPLDRAILEADANAAFADEGRAHFIMLLTDGRFDCSSAGGHNFIEDTIAALNTTRGIKTFVVGFGDSVNESRLSDYALAGGAPAPGPVPYYFADDAATLSAAVETIGGLVLGCRYTLAAAPADVNDLYVFFNDMTAIPRDQTRADGWDYDAATTSVEFYGPACAQLQSGSVQDLDIVTGCPEPVLE